MTPLRRNWRVQPLTLAVATVLLVACNGNVDRTSARQSPSANPPTPYRLSTHCGVLEIQFDGRRFYLESMNPADVLVGLDQPDDVGTMVLLSPHVVAFHDPAGHFIRFVDTPPGEIGKPYPFTAYLSSTDRLIDERFAGRVWHALGSLPGAVGPRSANGQDISTPVTGTFTLLSIDRATFMTSNGTEVPYVRSAPGFGCD
jgi:hypothetical protein